MKAMLIPPGGMAGFSQMTNASKYALQSGAATRSKTPRLTTYTPRAARKGSKERKRYNRNARALGQKQPKFGSPAWRKKFGLPAKRKRKRK